METGSDLGHISQSWGNEFDTLLSRMGKHCIHSARKEKRLAQEFLLHHSWLGDEENTFAEASYNNVLQFEVVMPLSYPDSF